MCEQTLFCARLKLKANQWFAGVVKTFFVRSDLERW